MPALTGLCFARLLHAAAARLAHIAPPPSLRAAARLQDHRRRSATAHAPPCAIRAAAQRSLRAACNRSRSTRAQPCRSCGSANAASAARAARKPPQLLLRNAAAPARRAILAAAHLHHNRSRSTLTRCLRFCLTDMGREKRKGKEVVVEKPARKRTRAEKEAERAEMVAKAAEEQATGRARPFAIRDPPARGRARGRGMGRVRGARATRATTEAAAAESDRSLSAAESDADTEAEQSEQSQEQSTQDSTTFWPHSVGVPSSRDFASDRASHWTEDARRSPATGASQVRSSSSSSSS